MAAGATYTPIATTTLGSAQSSVTFSSISSSYTDLILVANVKWTGSGSSSFGVRFNSDSGNNYSVTRLYGTGSSTASSRDTNISNTKSGQINDTNFSDNVFHIMNYSNATTYKTVLSRPNNQNSLTGSFVSLWRNTNAITNIDIGYFDTGSDNFAAGSTFTLYGILAA